MSNERVRRLREVAAQAEEQAMGRIQSGEIRHLHGKPLDLSDDSPTWFVNKLLKREGYSHPLIERGREVDTVQREVDAIVADLRRLNRATMFHNLAVPETLHRRPVLIEDAVEQLAREIPPLEAPRPPARQPGFWARFLRRHDRI